MNNGAVKIVAVGDMSFNGHFDRLLNRHGPDYPFRNVLPFWRDADLRIGNLESPPTSHSRASPCKFTLRGSPRSIESLKFAGFDCLCVANNHMMDFGQEGLLEACWRASEAGISVVGAGATLEQAYRPVVLKVRGQTIGILAYCDVTQDSPLYATQNSAGVARGELATCLDQVRSLRPHVDWLIVHLHWGTELARLPSPLQRQWAREMVAVGTNVVIGHHPHVLQPIETIDKAVVAYSLGDFIFSESFWRGRDLRGRPFSSKMRLNSLTRTTGWLDLTLSDSGTVEYRFYPAILSKKLQVVGDDSPRRATDAMELERQLAAEDYAGVFDVELQHAARRRARDNQYRTPARWLELKMFQWRILPWAVAEQESESYDARDLCRHVQSDAG
jgi:poly-gamma-glutamate synthesis protein (capsule biosynthesis protein)